MSSFSPSQLSLLNQIYSQAGANTIPGNWLQNASVALDKLDFTTIDTRYVTFAQLASGGQSGGTLIVPTGAILDFGGPSAPAGFLLCDGSAVSRTIYAALFAVVGTTYGFGDQLTTFNLPDCRGRTTVGCDPGGAAARVTTGGSGVDSTTLGATGGEETHLLEEEELASHAHASLYIPSYTGQPAVGFINGVGGASGTAVQGNHSLNTPYPISTSADPAQTFAHNNVQPTIVFNKIIKT